MPNALKYIFRFLSYTFIKLAIFSVAVALIVLAFFGAMDYMNVNVLVKDALEKRAEFIILQDNDQSALIKTFSKTYLAEDELLYSKEYEDYVIRDFNQKVEVNFKLIFPWQDTVEMIMSERISNINGELPKELVPEGATEEQIVPPQWQDGKYIITLERTDDNWRITKMELQEKIEKPEPTPTPSPS